MDPFRDAYDEWCMYVEDDEGRVPSYASFLDAVRRHPESFPGLAGLPVPTVARRSRKEANNPYVPASNPYINDAPQAPGTPDAEMDGPAPTTLTNVQAPTSTPAAPAAPATTTNQQVTQPKPPPAPATTASKRSAAMSLWPIVCRTCGTTAKVASLDPMPVCPVCKVADNLDVDDDGDLDVDAGPTYPWTDPSTRAGSMNFVVSPRGMYQSWNASASNSGGMSVQYLAGFGDPSLPFDPPAPTADPTDPMAQGDPEAVKSVTVPPGSPVYTQNALATPVNASRKQADTDFGFEPGEQNLPKFYVVDRAPQKYSGHKPIIVAGPFTDRTQASWAEMRHSDLVGWDGIGTEELTDEEVARDFAPRQGIVGARKTAEVVQVKARDLQPGDLVSFNALNGRFQRVRRVIPFNTDSADGPDVVLDVEGWSEPTPTYGGADVAVYKGMDPMFGLTLGRRTHGVTKQVNTLKPGDQVWKPTYYEPFIVASAIDDGIFTKVTYQNTPQVDEYISDQEIKVNEPPNWVPLQKKVADLNPPDALFWTQDQSGGFVSPALNGGRAYVHPNGTTWDWEILFGGYVWRNGSAMTDEDCRTAVQESLANAHEAGEVVMSLATRKAGGAPVDYSGDPEFRQWYAQHNNGDRPEDDDPDWVADSRGDFEYEIANQRHKHARLVTVTAPDLQVGDVLVADDGTTATITGFGEANGDLMDVVCDDGATYEFARDHQVQIQEADAAPAQTPAAPAAPAQPQQPVVKPTASRKTAIEEDGYEDGYDTGYGEAEYGATTEDLLAQRGRGGVRAADKPEFWRGIEDGARDFAAGLPPKVGPFPILVTDRYASRRKTSKIAQIVAAVLRTNPTMPKHAAEKVARKTVERYPAVVR